MVKVALVTGITGQDGAYLAAWLLEQGYRVVGGYRRTSTLDLWRLQELGVDGRVELLPLELLEYNNLVDVVRRAAPDDVYHLAAQSFVGVSFAQPLLTAEVTGLGTLRLLEALRHAAPEARFYQASTSEMFGGVAQGRQSETTAFHPRSPYGYAKLLAHWATVNAREAWGMHASCGILFNHESPLRGPEFVTRKITHGFAATRATGAGSISLGNLDARRDGGYAADYVRGMWQMLQRERADDFVLATGEAHTVRQFVGRAAAACGFDLRWEGEADQTIGRDATLGRVLVQGDAALYRPAEVMALCGDAAKAANKWGGRQARRSINWWRSWWPPTCAGPVSAEARNRGRRAGLGAASRPRAPRGAFIKSCPLRWPSSGAQRLRAGPRQSLMDEPRAPATWPADPRV